MDDLFGYKIVSCYLKHETFVKSASAIDPSAPVTDTEVWTRKGFCDKAFRNKSLSCAHSMAWVSWCDELRQYPDFWEAPEVRAKLLEMEQIRTGIFKLDHKKGALEKQKTESDKKFDEEKLIKIDQEYEKLVSGLETVFSDIKILFNIYKST